MPPAIAPAVIAPSGVSVFLGRMLVVPLLLRESVRNAGEVDIPPAPRSHRSRRAARPVAHAPALLGRRRDWIRGPTDVLAIYPLLHPGDVRSRPMGLAAKAGGPGDASLGMLLYRLARAPAITIAKVRGRARGGGDELALACDMVFASREKAVFGQFECATGAQPGAGGVQHL
jgi:hypothetical protein